jgi:shikimate kinase
MLITLTGFMGSGKSTVGRLVADALGCLFLDLDDEIVKKAGRSIPEIFADGGESAFRALEKETLERLVKKYSESTAVLALGGGTVTIPESIGLLQEKTTCIYLRASEDTIRKNLEGRTAGRPLADDKWPERLAQREPLYQKAAHVVLDTDGWSFQEMADEIIISCI